MPSNKSTMNNPTPFQLVCQQLTRALKKKGSFKLSDATLKKLRDALKTVRNDETLIPNTYIDQLISIISGPGDVCRRLEPKSYVAILESLLQAGYSRQKERGVYLLAQTLFYDNCNKHTSPLRHITGRKKALGSGCLRMLLNCFTNSAEDARFRKWVGLLVIELLKGSDENYMTFEAGPEDEKRRLGTMIVEEQNEILRIICGQLLKVLIAWGVPQKDLWPINTDPRLYSGFPSSPQNNKHWNSCFQTYIDNLFENSNPVYGVGKIFFCQAVTVTPCGFSVSGCSINLLVDSELSVCTSSDGDYFNESLDIPFHLISNVAIDEQIPDEQIPEHGTKTQDQAVHLVITLHPSEEALCYANAVPVTVNEVRITVQDDELAENIGKEILEAMERPKISQTSEVIAIDPPGHDWLHMGDRPSSHQSTIIAGTEASDTQILRNKLETTVVIPVMNSQDGEIIKDSPFVTDDVPERNKTISNIIEGRENVAELVVETRNLLREVSYESEPKEMALSQLGHRTISHESPRSREGNSTTSPGGLGLSDDGPRHLRPRGPKVSHIGALANMSIIKSTPARVVEKPPATNHPFRGTQSNQPQNKSTLSLTDHAPSQIISKQKWTGSGALQMQTKPKLAESNLIVRPSKKSVARPKLIPKIPKTSMKNLVPSIISKAAKKPVKRAVARGNRLSTEQNHLAKPDSNSGMSENHPKASRLQPNRLKKKVTTEPGPQLPEHLAVPIEYDKKNMSKLSALIEGLEDDIPSVMVLQEPERRYRVENGQSICIAASSGASRSPPQCSPRLSAQEAPPPRRSPRLSTQAKKSSEQNPTSCQILAESPRRSPRSHSGAKAATTILNSVLKRGAPLLDDRLIRKTPLVGFSRQGPRNQGSSSMGQLHKLETESIVKGHGSPFQTAEDEQAIVRKRKRSIEIATDRESLKRHQKSKFQRSPILPRPEGEDDDVHTFHDEPEVTMRACTPINYHNRALGSQNSRVDENGSPRASSTNPQQRENYMVIARKVLMDNTESDRMAEDEIVIPNDCYDKFIPPVANVFDVAILHDTRVEVPGQPNQLPMPPKAFDGMAKRPSKISRRDDVDLQKGDFLNQQGKLSDLLPVRKDRLQSDDFNQQLQRRKLIPTGKKVGSLRKTVQAGRTFRRNEDQEATLVAVEEDVEIEEDSSSSDERSGRCESSQELSPQEPILGSDPIPHDEWREALKPHQKGILGALYQISNDLIRYLTSHEQAIEDVLTEYREGGTTLVDALQRKQHTHSRHVQSNFDTSIKALEHMYRSSRSYTLKYVEDGKAKPVREVEKRWQHQQQQLQKMIEEGRNNIG